MTDLRSRARQSDPEDVRIRESLTWPEQENEKEREPSKGETITKKTQHTHNAEVPKSTMEDSSDDAATDGRGSAHCAKDKSRDDDDERTAECADAIGDGESETAEEEKRAADLSHGGDESESEDTDRGEAFEK